MRLNTRHAAARGVAAGRAPWRAQILTFAAIVGLSASLTGCVEVYVTLDLNADGSGRAAIRYLVPLAFIKGDKRPIEIESNKLLPLTRQDAQQIWGDRWGVQLADFASQDIPGDPNSVIPQGVRRIEMQLTFSDIEAISTGHFFFRYFPQDGKRYFVLRTVKNLLGGANVGGGEEGGMGRVMSGLIAGRRFTVEVNFPDRVIEANAGRKDFAHAVWSMPMGVLFNKVQEEVFMWAEMPGRKWDNMREPLWRMKRWYRGEDWANSDVFPSYIYMPFDEQNLNAPGVAVGGPGVPGGRDAPPQTR